jgi:hypothetical protein
VRTISVTLEVEIPDIKVSCEQLERFVEFYICQQGSMSLDHPLYNADYEITEFQIDD